MNDRNLQDLEKAASWDFESAQHRPPVKGGRAVVSVAFNRSDFERVAECAERRGLRTSEFIRQAALDMTAQNTRFAALTSISPSVSCWIVTGVSLAAPASAITRVRGAEPTVVRITQPGKDGRLTERPGATATA